MISKEENEALQKRVLVKREKYQEQGFADDTLEKTVNGKLIKMWLPNSVFVQQKLLSIAAKVFSSDFKDIDEEAELTERYYKAVCTHTQLDGDNVNAAALDLGSLQAFALLYWMELLYPLSLWGDEKSKEAILS